MIIDKIVEDKIFLYDENSHCTYLKLKELILEQTSFLQRFSRGHAFVVEAENSLETYSKFLSLLEAGNIVFLVPQYQFHDAQFRSFLESETKTSFFYLPKNTSPHDLDMGRPTKSEHPMIDDALSKKLSRFIVRTSGSSGKKFKFILHDPQLFLRKYQKVGSHFEKTFAFSPAESIAGIETLLETVFHNNQLVCAGDRVSPRTVVELIHNHQIDYFQTTPTFLNLLMVSGEVKEDKLNSLKKIAFGSEPPQKNVLAYFRQKLPRVEFMHTYGMSEIGIQKTVTSIEDPALLKMDENFNPARLIDGMIEVQSLTPMLTYLNHFTDDTQWFKTLDLAILENGFWRIKGRNSDLINLAGRKFFPIELEELLMNLNDVNDVIVSKEENEILGNVIIATISIPPEIDEAEFRRTLKEYCKEKVPFYMHPHKILLQKNAQPSSRFKKIRKV